MNEYNYEAIAYPSVKFNGQIGLNLAIRPDVVDSKLELFRILELCYYKNAAKGIFRIDNPAINNAFIEKLAFQCSNVMGKSFNAAHPFLDSESAELRMNFVHDSIAKNGIACVIRKTPAKIRLERNKTEKERHCN